MKYLQSNKSSSTSEISFIFCGACCESVPNNSLEASEAAVFWAADVRDSKLVGCSPKGVETT